jgi:ribonuclease P protein component
MGARPVGRVRDRATFDALRRDGRRARRGPVSVVFVPAPLSGLDAETRSRVAFAIGRPAGGAVRRNRARRRLRAVVGDLAVAGALPVGAWLLSARSDLHDVTPGELRELVGDAVVAAAGLAA